MDTRHHITRIVTFFVLMFALTLTSAATNALGKKAAAASWTNLTNLAPDSAGTMLLLTDGTIMVQGYSPGNNWMRLTPDSTGSYINGMWSPLASMNIPRLYYASHVLPSGKVWLLGGEYSGFGLPSNWTNTGEIYDPISNAWSPIASHPESQFGDDPTMLVKNGKILAGSLSSRNTYLYDIATNTWSLAAAKFYNDRSDEETWCKLPDGSVITYDIFKSVDTPGGYAELYNPVTNTWSGISPSDVTATGFLPALSSVALGYENGPTLRLQDGRIFFIGATQHTALYTPSTNMWTAGPDTVGSLSGNPAFFGADDASAAELPSDHVLFAADAGPTLGIFSEPTQLFDFDPDAGVTSPVTPPFPAQAQLNTTPAFLTRMLMLPTGQVLFSDASRQLWVYTPAGAPPQRLRPRIEGIKYNGGGVFTLTGQQLNGQSGGSSYGDDVESDSNYPIVRLTDKADRVFYARTTNWSTTEVATRVFRETVNFTLPAGLVPGVYRVEVSGAGITSVSAVARNITAAEIAGQ